MIDRDDSALERALRSDLPSTDARERVRRRLLAAGVAVGNGLAASTSAAAASTTTTAGAIAKALGASWGIKLGVAAAIAIPSVGLWVDAEPRPPATMAAPQPRRSSEQPKPVDSEPRLRPASVAAARIDEPPPASRAAEGAPRVLDRPGTDAARPSKAELPTPMEAPQLSSRAASTLAAETRLLDDAFASLASGERTRARALLAEHEAQFPAGLLLRERRRAQAKLAEIPSDE